nr:hypothetical protein [Micromonospora sp. DSM 115978]
MTVADQASADQVDQVEVLVRQLDPELPLPWYAQPSDAGADLVAIGIPVSRVLDLSEALQQDLVVVAQRLLQVVSERVVHPDSADLMPPSGEVREVVELIEKLRPHAQRTAEALLARALTAETDRLFRRFVDSVRPT